MERVVSSTYHWCPWPGRGQLVPPPLAGRAVAGFFNSQPLTTVERKITRDRAAPLACAGLPLGRIAPHDARASPGAPHGHPNRARGVGVSHPTGVG